MMSKKILQFYKKYQAPLLSGLLIGTSFIPFPPWALFFAWVPLWIYWSQQKSLKDIIKGAWITQIVLSLIGFYWITTVSQEHGHLPLPIALLVLAFFCMTAMYYIPLSGALWFLIKKRKTLSPLKSFTLMALITALIESVYPTLFPWNFGYPWFYSRLPGFNLADIIGFQGLSSLTLLINIGFLWTYIKFKSGASYLRPLIVSLGLILFLNGAGYLHRYETPKPYKTIKVLAVQANIGNLQKEYAVRGANFRSEIIRKYSRLTRQGVRTYKPDLILWPETAYPNTVGLDLKNSWQGSPLSRLVKSLKTPLITGAYFENPKTQQISNTIYPISANGTLVGSPYKKTYLLAYGEYLPGGELFPFLKDMLPQVADFERGSGPKVFKFLDLKIGAQICYESLYPEFTRKLAKENPDFIVNLTNDSWFGEHSEPVQHLYMTLARAIEVRKPLIRATNTGITTAILADGTILEQSPIYKEWLGLFKIPITKNAPATFYQKFPWTISLLLLLFFALILLLKNNDSSNKPS